MDELYRQEYSNSLHMKEQIVYSSNTIEACVETLADTNAILFFPSNMESYFKPFNIVSLSLSETPRVSSIGIYLLRERQDDPQLKDMVQLMRQNFTENQARVE
jgi:DNA-binding transcriptional LysR family regulator